MGIRKFCDGYFIFSQSLVSVVGASLGLSNMECPSDTCVCRQSPGHVVFLLSLSMQMAALSVQGSNQPPRDLRRACFDSKI